MRYVVYRLSARRRCPDGAPRTVLSGSIGGGNAHSGVGKSVPAPARLRARFQAIAPARVVFEDRARGGAGRCIPTDPDSCAKPIKLSTRIAAACEMFLCHSRRWRVAGRCTTFRRYSHRSACPIRRRSREGEALERGSRRRFRDNRRVAATD